DRLLVEQMTPCMDRVAAEQRRDMPPRIDRREMEGVGQSVETERARDRHDMAALDRPPAVTTIRPGILAGVDARRVLVEPHGKLMLAFLDRHAVHMIDLRADLVVVEAPRAARKHVIIVAD